MLIALILIVWLSLIAIFWAVCAAAKRGDADLRVESKVDQGEDAPDMELAVPDGPPEPTVRGARRASSRVR
jgi:hypothetical protein